MKTSFWPKSSEDCAFFATRSNSNKMMMVTLRVNTIALVLLPGLTFIGSAGAQFADTSMGYAFENPGFLSLAGVLAYDNPRHRLAVLDEGQDAIYIFDLTDRSFQTIETGRGYYRATGIAFGRDGALFICQEKSPIVVIVTPESNATDTLDLTSSAPEKFRPGRIHIGPREEIFILDTEGKSIYRFDSAGELLAKISENLRHPDGILSRASGGIFIADKGFDPIRQFDSSGEYVRDLTRPELPTEQSNFAASGLAADQRGWFYTIDYTHNKMTVFDPTGVNRIEWAPDIPPFFPRDIAIDKLDNIYISETGAGRVLVVRRVD
jgi:streptogramin lyase